MADKSPRQHMQKKAAGSSIKEKRSEKRAKAASASEIMPSKKSGR
jgi:hypothetical protein